ncbi:MAG: hypothetical protein ACP5E4_00210 [Candidatus Aenigmatarchaeota archaeon]
MFGKKNKPENPKEKEELPKIPESDAYKRYKADEAYYELGKFEKLCKFAHKFIPLKAPGPVKKMLSDPLYMSGMQATEDEVWAGTLLVFLLGSILSIPLILSLGMPSGIFALSIPLFLAYNILIYPPFYADVVRIKAGNETVDIILYMVIYLSLNPVFEKALEFAAINCHGPLGGDLKKIMWDTEIGKFTTIREAVGVYSKKWSIWNNEFVEALITLQMVATQPTMERRRLILDEALNRTLKTTFDKMEQYSKDMKVPSMMILTFGILMPLMGLIMFPMVSIFLAQGSGQVFLIAIGYNIILPSMLLWYLYRLISRRPSAFSHSEKTGGVQPKKYFEIKKPPMKLPIKWIAVLIFLIVSLPGLLHYTELWGTYNVLHDDERFSEEQQGELWKDYCEKSYDSEKILLAVFEGMFLIWGIAAAIIFYGYMSSAEPYRLEKFIRKTEDDFEVGLFELQVALAQNIPVELAIPNVLDKYERMNKKSSPMYVFFSKIYNRISQLSLTFRQALYDEQTGVLKDFPSPLIANIMNIIASAFSKGPIIISNAAKDIINCLRKTSEIEHMIGNLLESVISNIKTQAGFIAPLIGAIIAAMSVIIVTVLQKISVMIEGLSKSFGQDIGSSISDSMSMIQIKDVMPPTVLELIIGLYILESVVIMCVFLTGIERGFDSVYRNYLIATTLAKAMAIYSVVFFIMTIAGGTIVNLIAI